jgi:hypothetical protein
VRFVDYIDDDCGGGIIGGGFFISEGAVVHGRWSVVGTIVKYDACDCISLARQKRGGLILTGNKNKNGEKIPYFIRFCVELPLSQRR